jgi:hypothetical protein
MRIAITGHRGLPAETERLVDRAIREQLAAYAGPDVVGVSNLADGADQLFAQAVLDAGGQLEVIVPAAHYRDGLPASTHAAYDALLARAAKVDRLNRVESTEQAHMEASQAMIARADRLFAVWDGKPARGYGGTADVVAEARNLGVPVRCATLRQVMCGTLGWLTVLCLLAQFIRSEANTGRLLGVSPVRLCGVLAGAGRRRPRIRWR